MKKITLLFSFLLLSACASGGGSGGSSYNPSVVAHKSAISSSVKDNHPGIFKVGNPYKVAGQSYVPRESYNFTQTGIASWYGPNFHGKRTANGEIFDMNDITAAHKTLQIPSIVRVTNLENGRSIVVRINDRGPFKRGRIIDLSRRSAELLQFKNQGTARVRVQVLPEESRKVAEIARQGRPTAGYEIALNHPGAHQSERFEPPSTPVSAPVVVAAASARDAVGAAYGGAVNAVPSPVSAQPLSNDLGTGLSKQDLQARPQTQQAVPDDSPVTQADVQRVPVLPTQIYVQAGAFSEQANALRYADTLSQFGKVDVYPAQVNGQQFFRVRFGPIAEVEKADAVLGNLVDAGVSNAIIVVD